MGAGVVRNAFLRGHVQSRALWFVLGKLGVPHERRIEGWLRMVCMLITPCRFLQCRLHEWRDTSLHAFYCTVKSACEFCHGSVCGPAAGAKHQGRAYLGEDVCTAGAHILQLGSACMRTLEWDLKQVKRSAVQSECMGRICRHAGDGHALDCFNVTAHLYACFVERSMA